ncbi:hypothetical protein IEO21_09251 [Rhodonia placenta]|uniref:Uncharacterized protein n=1 Tax=Rhodonia placenta TaxID=104341 RepID=A0A8H7TY24_9APHY|nr:hypothetical protein IEO21_09251 [Postia placenta]
MASTSAALPRLDKIFLVGIWLETVLWGIHEVARNFYVKRQRTDKCISVVIFASAIWIIFWKRGGSTQWMLGITSTILFSFATIHISVSLQQLLEAFIYIPPGASPLYSTLYWADDTTSLSIIKDVLYDTTVWLQDIVLIWRLYIVWNRNWKICVAPIIVDLAHMAAAYGATILEVRGTVSIYSPVVKGLGLAGWSLDLVVNISVTLVIAARLWYMGMKVTSMTSSRTHSSDQQWNKYLAPIFTIIESGALFAAVTIVMLILYLTGNPVTLAALGIATQLAVTTPLLIIVRVGLGLTHGLPKAYKNLSTTVSDFQAATLSQSGTYGGSAIRFAPSRDIATSSASSQGEMVYVMQDFKVADSLGIDEITTKYHAPRVGGRALEDLGFVDIVPSSDVDEPWGQESHQLRRLAAAHEKSLSDASAARAGYLFHVISNIVPENLPSPGERPPWR